MLMDENPYRAKKSRIRRNVTAALFVMAMVGFVVIVLDKPNPPIERIVFVIVFVAAYGWRFWAAWKADGNQQQTSPAKHS
jgi:protein-S-isoprenylcysteine O-methyltransferase Ste14